MKGRKDILAGAKQKGVDVDTGIVTGKLNEKCHGHEERGKAAINKRILTGRTS